MGMKMVTDRSNAAIAATPTRLIQDTWFQATGLDTTMSFLSSANRSKHANPLTEGQRRLGWFTLPAFQPPVWTEAQRVRFIESCWMRLPIGAFVFNDAPGTRFDQWLLDGQQRVGAALAYMADEFPVFGHLFSELTEVDHRIWDMSISFPCRRTNLKDEAMLREVYDRLAYGGTPHEPKGA
jgi:hypothetical protein